MIIEYTWSEQELLQKKCYKCKYLELYDDFNGKCTVPVNQYNKKLIRDRSVTSKKCSHKSINFINCERSKAHGM